MQIRPLTIMALIYRCWSTLRMRHSAAWQDLWVHEGLSGGVRGKGAQDTYLPFSLESKSVWEERT